MKGISQDKIDRIKPKKRNDPCLFYPDDTFKIRWDLFSTFVLLVTCIMTPLSIAFNQTEPSHILESPVMITEYVIDLIFFIDILITFNSAYYEHDVDLIENRG